MNAIMRNSVCGLLCAAMLSTAEGQIQTAGNLLINIDPSAATAGALSWITNSGTEGGVFQATGLPTGELPVLVTSAGGAKGIMFDGRNFLEHVTGPSGTVKTLPADLTGANRPCTIEVWALNPSTWENDGEAMVTWGLRGTGGNMMVFSYSANGDHGATDHWGGNLGWTPSIPAMGQWHHLVYTFDGVTQTIYADGVLNKSGTCTYNPAASAPITLAAGRESSGALVGWGGTRGSLTLGKVRIHTGVLTAAQVAQNYNTEKAGYVIGSTPLASKPVHRYSFNLAATNDASGLTVPNTGVPGGGAALIQGTHGLADAAATGSKVRLLGGDPADSSYIDLPNGIVSALSSSNGGPGKVTVEGWAVVTGGAVWPRIFDFGSSEAGEVTAPGGAGAGRNYFMLAQVDQWRDWHQIEVNNHGFNGGPNVASAQPFGNANNDSPGTGMKHYAVTWDELSGEIRVYINGVETTRMTSLSKMNQIDDVNAWLGRSNWLGDQVCPIEYDEFRVYAYALSPEEIRNNIQAGPDAVAVAPGPLQAVYLTLPRVNMTVSHIQQAVVMADYQNVSNVNVTTAPSIVYTSSDTNVATVSSAGVVTAVGAGPVTITATLAGKSDSENVTVAPLTATLTHRYMLNTDAADSIGGEAWNGTIDGGASFDSTQLVLDGFSGYLQLPTGIITNNEAVTIETWASFGSQLDWVRLFDFGANINGQHHSLFLTPQAGGNWLHLGIEDGTTARWANRPGGLAGQNNVHIAAVVNPYAGFLGIYVNGVLAAVNTSSFVPVYNFTDITNYVGRSLWPNDPYLNGSINEFRIYSGVLTPSRLAVNLAAGPDSIVSNPGALVSLSLVVSNQMPVGASYPSALLGNFANVTGVNMYLYGGATVTSSDTNIVRISSTGLVTAVAPGTATLTASSGSVTDAKSVTVVIQAPVLAHRYSFNDAAGSFLAADSVGGAPWAGTVNGGALLDGSKLVLDGFNTSNVQLPVDILDNFLAVTFDVWASFGANNDWVRLYDFGETVNGSGNTSIFFSPRTGQGTIEQTIFSTARNDHIALPGALDNQSNVHITCVYNPYSGSQTLYLNGRMVGHNAAAGVLLADINDIHNYIGRSLFDADAGLKGSIDEFRIYNGALNAQQVAVNQAAGPNTLVANPGNLVSVTGLSVVTNMIAEQTQQARLLANFQNISGVNLFLYANPAVTSSDTNVFTVTPAGVIEAVAPGEALLTATYNSVAYVATIKVSMTAFGLKHRYSFGDDASSQTALDSVGTAHGALAPGAFFDGAGRLFMDGVSGFATLPAGVIAPLANLTIESWVTATNTASWTRVFDFGMDEGGAPGSYLFLSARGAPGMRFAAKPAMGGELPRIDSPAPLAVDQETHVAVSYNVSANTAALYVNGVLVGSADNITPLDNIVDNNNWLGRSSYASDAMFGGSYNEFRIWEGAMTAGEAAASYAAGPQGLPYPSLSITASGGSAQITWPAWAVRYKLQSTTSLTAPTWTTVPGTPTKDATGYHQTVPAAGAPVYYRLSN